MGVVQVGDRRQPDPGPRRRRIGVAPVEGQRLRGHDERPLRHRVPPTATFCPTSFGILQSKWYFRPGVYPGTRISTAFNLDSTLAETRGCLDGLEFFGPISKGNLWGCVGVWFSGAWGVGDASYIANVQSIYAAKPWLSWKG